MATTLANIPPGTRIRLTGYDEESDYTAQLRRLGLVPGTQATVLRTAPFGDPLEIRLRGYSLAIRPTEAAGLRFEVLS
jgi:ferrous iron transport protein A